jgi:hypothetical protein
MDLTPRAKRILAPWVVGLLGASAGVALGSGDGQSTACPSDEQGVREFLEANAGELASAIRECPEVGDSVRVLPENDLGLSPTYPDEE